MAIQSPGALGIHRNCTMLSYRRPYCVIDRWNVKRNAKRETRHAKASFDLCTISTIQVPDENWYCTCQFYVVIGMVRTATVLVLVQRTVQVSPKQVFCEAVEEKRHWYSYEGYVGSLSFYEASHALLFAQLFPSSTLAYSRYCPHQELYNSIQKIFSK